MALGEIAYLSPWIFVPLAAGVSGRGAGGTTSGNLFLLCLALPPIVVFTITPLWGARGFPHWTTPGWFFAFALMGAWIDERARRRGLASLGLRLRRCAGGGRRRRRPAELDGLAVAPDADCGPASPTRRSRRSTGERCAPRLPSTRARFRRRGQLAGCRQDRPGARSGHAGLCHFQTIRGDGPSSGTATALSAATGFWSARAADLPAALDAAGSISGRSASRSPRR